MSDDENMSSNEEEASNDEDQSEEEKLKSKSGNELYKVSLILFNKNIDIFLQRPQ